MNAHICPRCLEEYRDALNRINIVLIGYCLSCEAEVQRFENEGGPFMNNDSC